MGRKALLRGNAGNYRIRGTIWDLGSFAYRAYVHLVPPTTRPDLSWSVVPVDGMTLQEVLGAAKAQVKSTVGTPVERLEVRAVPRNSEPLLGLDPCMADGRRSRSEYATGEVLAARFLRLLAQLSDRELEALAVTDPRSAQRLMSNQTRSPTKRRTAIPRGVRAGPERGPTLR